MIYRLPHKCRSLGHGFNTKHTDRTVIMKCTCDLMVIMSLGWGGLVAYVLWVEFILCLHSVKQQCNYSKRWFRQMHAISTLASSPWMAWWHTGTCFPIAFVAITFGNEIKKGWMSLHLSINAPKNITIITNQDKGLEAVVMVSVPPVFHSHCALLDLVTFTKQCLVGWLFILLSNAHTTDELSKLNRITITIKILNIRSTWRMFTALHNIPQQGVECLKMWICTHPVSSGKNMNHSNAKMRDGTAVDSLKQHCCGWNWRVTQVWGSSGNLTKKNWTKKLKQ